MGEHPVPETTDRGTVPTHSDPWVTVVVPTRDRADKIDRLIGLLLDNSDPVQLVVVDDGSVDRTPEVLAGWSAKDSRLLALQGTGKDGQSQARLVGACEATGDVLVLLDDDVVPAAGLVAGHLRWHTPGTNRLVLGYMPTYVPDPLPRGSFATRLYATEYEDHCKGFESDASTVLTGLWLGNMSIRRERYLAAFDAGCMPNFPYRHEDMLFGLILRDMGVEPIFDRSLFAQHYHDRPLEAFRRDSYTQGQGRAAIYRLRPDESIMTPAEFAVSGMPTPVKWFVQSTKPGPIRRVAGIMLSAAITTSGRLRSRRGELAFARVLRRVDMLAGARDVLEATKD